MVVTFENGEGGKKKSPVLELDLYCSGEATYVKKEMKSHVDRPLLSSQSQMG